MRRKLTEDDINAIMYFYEEKDDVTRYCDWEDIMDDFESKFPEVFIAIKNLNIARIVLDPLMSNLEIDDDS